MSSVKWLQALALDALKRTEYHGRASIVPYDREMLREVTWSLYHSPLRLDKIIEGNAEADLNRRRFHKQTAEAYNVCAKLCHKIKVKFR